MNGRAAQSTGSFVTMRDVVSPAVELSLVTDAARRAAPLVPVALIIGGLGWGWAGVASVAIGVAMVIANLFVAAWLMSTTARISLSLMMGTVLMGYLLRLGLLLGAVLALRNQTWIAVVPLCFTMVVAHLGSLAWETRYVSASLAFPGLKPNHNCLDRPNTPERTDVVR